MLSKKIVGHITENLRFYSQNPFSKTVGVISNDIQHVFSKNQNSIEYPSHADVVIIGGGLIGSAVAYALKSRAGEGLSVVVLEKDVAFQKTKQNMLGSIIQHYSLPENVFLAQYGSQFLRNIKEHLGNDVNIQFRPLNYLVLACDKYANKLENTVIALKEFGSRNELLTPCEINKRYPWINIGDIKLGCLGSESEGVFNSSALHDGLVTKSVELGATYVQSEVVGFELEQQRDMLMEGVAPGSFERINKVIYRTPNNEEYSVKFAVCVLAAGADSGDVAKLAKIGVGDGLLNIPLPIKQRESRLYLVEDNAKKMKLSSPFVMDTTGLWFRRDSIENNITCGSVPSMSDGDENLTNEEYLDNVIRPCLINRLPDLKNEEIKYIHTEVLDSNVFDDTPIVGPHPYHTNLYIASGFGKLGYSHAAGIGRAITELIIDSHFTTIDLTRFTFDRLITNQPLVEFNVY